MLLLDKLKSLFNTRTTSSHGDSLCVASCTTFSSGLVNTVQYEKDIDHSVDVIHSCSNLSYLLADSGILAIICKYDKVSLKRVIKQIKRESWNLQDSRQFVTCDDSLTVWTQTTVQLEKLIPLVIESIEIVTVHNSTGYKSSPEVENVSEWQIVNFVNCDDESECGQVKYYKNRDDVLISYRKL